jgi:hypothetical protein
MPDRSPPQQTPSPHLPINWSGGVLEGHLAPLVEDWWDEDAYAEGWHLNADWTPLEHLVEADPPETERFDPGGGGAGAPPRQTEPRSGAVLRVSATGVILDDFDQQWLNTSRFHPTVDLREVRVGDVCLARVELSREGRAYLTALTVLPLDGPAAPAPDAKTHGLPGEEHMEPEGGGR